MKLLRVSVVTPSLNKSFKFQSDWPYNNSQIYLLTSILEDLLEDEDREFKTNGDGYYFSSSVNYPNNKSLVKQKVYVDKDANITKAEVVDKDDNIQIVMEFKTQEYNKKFDTNYFELSELLKINSKSSTSNNTTEERKSTTETENNNSGSTNDSQTQNNETTTNNSNSSTNSNTNNNSNSSENTNNTTNNSTNQSTTEESKENQEANSEKKTEQTATIDDVIYPMYLPSNTYLTSQETVDTKDGQRLILTFGGDSSFVLVEETVGYSEDGLVIPVSGEFDFLSDVIGVIGTNSLTWHSNGIEYYMVSETVETSELVEIARSISVLPVSK